MCTQSITKMVEGKETAPSSSRISPPLICEPESIEPSETPAGPSRLRARKKFSKQLAMLDTRRDVMWEKMRYRQERHQRQLNFGEEDLSDEDLRELKGCIELGFGFKEEEGQKLCSTLPALDLYFAVNRQVSPVPSPVFGRSSSACPAGPDTAAAAESLRSETESLKIISAGDDPEQVKTRLRHWAQAVACSVMQSY